MIPISKVKLLPIWCITDKMPAFYDVESATAIEQTAKLYGAMRNLQEKYNLFATEINKTIEEFITGVNADQECFEKRMTKVIHDYLDYLETKVKNQDKVIAEAVSFMKTNLKTSITELIAQMHESGEFDEAVLNAIDNIGERVATLETITGEHTASIEDLITRVISLESNKLTTEYDTENKKLTLYIGNEGSGE